MTEQTTNRRAEDKNVQVLATKIEGLAQDMSEMKHGITKMADALTKLAIVEERQTQTILAQERAFKALERVEERQRTHELVCKDQDKGLRQLIADSNERLSGRLRDTRKDDPRWRASAVPVQDVQRHGRGLQRGRPMPRLRR